MSPPDEFELSGGTLTAETEIEPGILEQDPAAEEVLWEENQW